MFVDNDLHLVNARFHQEYLTGRLPTVGGANLQDGCQGAIDIHFHASRHGNQVVRENFKIKGLR
jgi:hypothetical protein